MTRIDRDLARAKLLKYTVRAFGMLPPVDSPRILDIGCGSGVATLELARMSGGTVVGIDIDEEALAVFRERVGDAGLQDRVSAENRSLFDIDYREDFDIVWAEGSLFIIGFARGLREWRRLIRPGGFLVVHEPQADMDVKFREIEEKGFVLLGHFKVSTQDWMDEYYRPLLDQIDAIPAEDIDGKTRQEIDSIKNEVRGLEENPEQYSSAFFILQKP
jgi:SAM-dependent methyltransferase